MKLTIGTVQFGIPYGINNTKGIPDDLVLRSVFAAAQAAGIQMLDTARAYGNAEERIGQLSGGAFKIISKFGKITTPNALSEQLHESLRCLKTSRLYAYLAHDANTFIDFPELWKALESEKALGNVEKIGYSLYSPDQLSALLEQGCYPDLVQVPYSILDRKFEAAMKKLKDLGVEIHVRSVFLQGLYFMNPASLPEKLQGLSLPLQQLHAICEEQELSVAALALQAALLHPHIDQVVIGVESLEQLQNNLQLANGIKDIEPALKRTRTIHVEHSNLLNPVNW